MNLTSTSVYANTFPSRSNNNKHRQVSLLGLGGVKGYLLLHKVSVVPQVGAETVGYKSRRRISEVENGLTAVFSGA